jgi:hypothetical protein
MGRSPGLRGDDGNTRAGLFDSAGREDVGGDFDDVASYDGGDFGGDGGGGD